MSKILVSIFYKNFEGKNKGIKVALPYQLTCEEIISSLVEKLSLKLVDENGEELKYSFFFKTSKEELLQDKTLEENEVKENELLLLKPIIVENTQEIAEEETKKIEESEIEEIEESEADTVQVLEKKRCPLCNEEVSEMEAFCHNCGQRLISREAEPIKQEVEEQENNKQELEHRGENKSNSKVTLIIAILSAIIIIVSGILIVFLTRNNAPVKTNKDDVVTEIPTDPFDGSEQTTLLDEAHMTVDVTIPKNLQTDDEYSAVLTKNQQDRGFISVKQNADNSITYTIRKDAWRTILTELKKDVIKTINETNNDESFPSIEKITYNKDFSKITFEVNRQLYENSMDSFAGMSVYLGVAYYRLFAQLDASCTITVVDSTTKETIDTMSFPEGLQ